MLLLAGTDDQLAAFDQAYATDSPTATTAVIIGGGRVGRAIGRAFAAEGVEFAIIEQLPERVREGSRYVVGDAADRSVLEESVDHRFRVGGDTKLDLFFLESSGTKQSPEVA